VPASYRTQIQEVLLAALARAVGRWTGGRSVAVALEGHGREDLFAGADISRTVGWFTSLFPVVLDAGRGGVEETLKTVKEQLRAVPRAGVGYGVLRYLNEEGAASLGRVAGGVEWELGFNYLGQFDQVVGGGDSLFEAARESAGPSQSPRQQRAHELEVNAMVAGGRLRVSWTYGRERLDAEEVREVAVGYLDELRAVVEHCAGEESGGFTPSDFAEFDFSQDELDDIAGAIGKAKGGLR
jgi:non-ribosomal peptide synthase protein (TIGR01720 family)